MDSRLRISAFITAATIAAAVLGAGVAVASTPDSTRHRNQVTFTSTNAITPANIAQALPTDLSRCGTPTNPALPCVIAVGAAPGFDWTFTGALQGVVHNESEASIGALISFDPAKPDLPYVDMFKFTGTVTGCGTGTFIMQTEGNSDPGGTWKVVKHSGTGALSGLSGNGTQTRFSGFNYTYTGRFACNDDH